MTTDLTFKEVVNLMTNHQRNQWAKGGYKGLAKKDPKGPAKYIGTAVIERAEERKAAKLRAALS